ncbi:gamma-butyrobetaine hydroxylase-like domain-containing protein [Antarcticimicrobium sediminis]|uniref:gamma-butyrobetaine hydroxylase-like domain-containing protein n=1 Tax=Antarcticimicrobium sediminis TaxID=2546227 RepID=UPI001FDF9FE6|nr:gamma-butyrobetaine hydroxylase-like domain-containing protein [Antarcticimicrobium sediminis]
MTIHTVLVRADTLVVSWADGSSSSYPTIWLRDNCPSGLHPQTHERLLDLLALEAAPVLTSAQLDGDHVVLSYGDGHVSPMPVGLLSAHRPGQRAADAAAIAPQLWRGDDRANRPASCGGPDFGGRPRAERMAARHRQIRHRDC